MKDYTLILGKTNLREEIFSNTGFKKVVGLGGPNINEYIQNLRNKGFEKISIWERDIETAIHQITSLKNCNSLEWNFGDILEAAIEEDVLYDFDFCNAIIAFRKHIVKFRDNFVFTFTVRPTSIDATLRLFASYREEFVTGEIDRTSGVLQTNKNTYNFKTYINSKNPKDGRGGTMIMIYKF